MSTTRAILGSAFLLALILTTTAAITATNQGDNATDFQLPNLDGQSVMQLYDYLDKPTLLVFWVSWCLHCQREVPVLDNMNRDLAPKGMNTIGVSVDDSVSDARGFVKQYEIGFSNMLAVAQVGQAVLEEYGVEAVPTMFVIDKGGMVKARFDGETEEKTIRDEFAQLGVK